MIGAGKHRPYHAFVVVAAAAVFLGAALLLFLKPLVPPGTQLTVDSATTPEACFLLVQTANRYLDGYQLDLYVQSANSTVCSEFFIDSDSPLLLWGTLSAKSDGTVAVSGNGWRLATYSFGDEHLFLDYADRYVPGRVTSAMHCQPCR